MCCIMDEAKQVKNKRASELKGVAVHKAMQALNSIHMHTGNVQFEALYIMEDVNEQNSELYLHFIKYSEC